MEGNSERAIGRCLSCRGVAFESNFDKVPTIPLQPIITPSNNERNGRWVWIPWGQKISFDVFPFSQVLERSMSRPSSHFCDLDLTGDEENGGQFHYLDEEDGEIFKFHNPIFVNDVEKQAKRRNSRLSILLLDQGLFTVYKCLFVFCLTLNVIALILAAIGFFPYAKNNATLFSVANILALCLCRSEAFLRLVFWMTVKFLGRPWIPLAIKTAATAFLQCIGGVHSGCGVSSIMWLVYSLVLTLKDREKTSPEILAVAFSILSLLCISSAAAFPLVRHLHHNVFERTHRFAGWIALVLLWVFIILTNTYDPISGTYRFRTFRFETKLEFWFTLAITVIIILPWVTIKKVPIKISSSSNHASIIKFDGGVQAGLLGRISPSPLSQWHAFGIISDGEKGHMMLAGAVGDFTKSLISNPPSHLWVRKVHFAGLPYLTNLYKRVVLVATGSGICVFLSFLLQPCSAQVCLVWVAKGVEENYGKEISEMVCGYPKDKVIVHDTAIMGRPNVAKMSVEAAKNWKAEVVIVTSNPEGSRDVIKECKSAGIPAFGPIWDS